MSQPKLGMHYEDVRKRVKRVMFSPGDPVRKGRLVDSLMNQVRLGEGETAQDEIAGEIAIMQKGSSSFSGRGSKQIGYGPGKRLGGGKWRYQDGEWVPVL